MKHIRISIAQVMGLVIFMAVGIAALRSPTPLAASALLTFTLAALAFASLAAVCLRINSRAYWIGFAIMGWGYLAMSYGPLSDARLSRRLATTLLIDGLYRRVEYVPKEEGESVWVDFAGKFRPGTVTSIDGIPAGGTQVGLEVDLVNNTAKTTVRPHRLRAIDPDGYRVLGHSLLCPLLACLGGVIAACFASRPGRTTRSTACEGIE